MRPLLHRPSPDGAAENLQTDTAKHNVPFSLKEREREVMGSNTSFSGEISIRPPLNWMEIKKVQKLSIIAERYEINLSIDEKIEDTDEGEISIKTCSAITPYTRSPYKGYNVQRAVQEVMDACPGHTFGDYIEGVQEDGFGMFRIAIDGSSAVRITPEITWPMPS